MKKGDVFIGTIKQCKNLEKYQQYGDNHYVKECNFDDITYGVMEEYTSTLTNQAILIKYDENRFVWLNSLVSKADEVFVSCGIPIKIIGTKPNNDNELFVDTRSKLIPYYDNLRTQKTNIAKLKKDIEKDEYISRTK